MSAVVAVYLFTDTVSLCCATRCGVNENERVQSTLGGNDCLKSFLRSYHVTISTARFRESVLLDDM